MGEGTGERIINPQTYIEAAEDSYMEMETTQIKGVDSTKRFSKAILQDRAKLVIKEKIMTHGKQYAETSFEVDLNGTDSSAHLVSRSVARDDSKQLFLSKVNGNAKCAGHSECDAIIMDNGCVSAIPEISANCVDAALIHEAAIGKIARRAVDQTHDARFDGKGSRNTHRGRIFGISIDSLNGSTIGFAVCTFDGAFVMSC